MFKMIQDLDPTGLLNKISTFVIGHTASLTMMPITTTSGSMPILSSSSKASASSTLAPALSSAVLVLGFSYFMRKYSSRPGKVESQIENKQAFRMRA